MSNEISSMLQFHPPEFIELDSGTPHAFWVRSSAIQKVQPTRIARNDPAMGGTIRDFDSAIVFYREHTGGKEPMAHIVRETPAEVMAKMYPKPIFVSHEKCAEIAASESERDHARHRDVSDLARLRKWEPMLLRIADAVSAMKKAENWSRLDPQTMNDEALETKCAIDAWEAFNSPKV